MIEGMLNVKHVFARAVGLHVASICEKHPSHQRKLNVLAQARTIT